MNFAVIVLVVMVTMQLPDLAHAHGRLIRPPSRSSGWRLGIKEIPVEYTDNQQNCGGFANQQANGGKCGICGDPWQGPRRYERPLGKMVPNMVITAKYTQGQIITVNVEITASHLGWHEFRICDTRQTNGIEATQECLDRTLLKDAQGKSRFSQGPERAMNTYSLKLPQDLTCPQCVLQWKWHAGNNKPVSGPQEEFYGCSDVTINSGSEPHFTPPTQPTTPLTVRPPQTAHPTASTPPTEPPMTTEGPRPWNNQTLDISQRIQNYIYYKYQLVKDVFSRTHIGK